MFCAYCKQHILKWQKDRFTTSQYQTLLKEDNGTSLLILVLYMQKVEGKDRHLVIDATYSQNANCLAVTLIIKVVAWLCEFLPSAACIYCFLLIILDHRMIQSELAVESIGSSSTST